MKVIYTFGLVFVVLLTGHFVRAEDLEKTQQMEDFGPVWIETAQNYNWFEAWNECAIRNMTLIALDSSDKNAALIKILNEKSIKLNLWIGGNDFAREGRFVWFSTGKSFSFSNWSKGNPDNHNGGNCVDIWGATDYEWNDPTCNSTCGFVCEENPFLAEARKTLEIKMLFIEQVLKA